MREDCEINYKDAVFKISTTKQKLKQKEYLQTGEIPVIDQGQDVIGGYTNDKNRILNCKLPVIVFGDHTKNVKLIKFPFAPGADGTKVLEPKTYISPSYLYYVTEVLVFKIKDKGYARHYQYIEKENFPLVSVPEQKAIVKKIEELFSSLDSGIADLKKSQDQLKIYRQAVLKKAFEGDWEKVKLGELITYGPTNGMYKPKSFYGSGTPILRIDGFYDGKINSWDSLKKLQLEDSELETYSLQNDDIVVNRVNSMPYVGKSAIVKNLNGNCVFESNIMRLRVDDKIISPNFLVQFLISPNGYSELQKNVKHAVNQSSINQADVKNAIIPIPSLKEQHQIVSDIESRLSVCDKIEKDISKSLEKAQALRQSILKKAFEGKLLSEGAIAKCKADEAYEPASVLLERIKKKKK